jgi:vacuolar-type H+-ATPase catalytic subunit A/Vma1
VAGTSWALDPALAHQLQFTAIDCHTSSDLSAEAMGAAFDVSCDPGWWEARVTIVGLLQRDGELRETASIVGPEALEDRDRHVLQAAAIIRGRPRADAHDVNDAYSLPARTYRLARVSLGLFEAGEAAMKKGATFDEFDLSGAAAHWR